MREVTLRLPANGWKPRWYQQEAWDYLGAEAGKTSGKHAELIWHRRAGKDEICMHLAACEMHNNPATYWHMLPLANQVRKAIWESINPHSGKRRLYEAFPPELFTHRDTDMLVRSKATGATWQCLGSDNYDSAEGSPPRGITYSEWALANPSVRGYLRPIIAENKGWQVFITTPRGKNHAYSTYKAAEKNPDQFAQILTVHDTGILTPEQLKIELMEYVSTYGDDMGLALYMQEYECSFDAAILGAYYGAELARVDKEGRIAAVAYDDSEISGKPMWPVHTAWDLGFDDDTAIWFYQVVGKEIRILEYFYSSGKDIDYYADVIESKPYQYGKHWLPHDAKAKTLAAKGKSIEEQLAQRFGWGSIRITPNMSIEDGIQAARKLFPRMFFDESCEPGIECLRQYHREWDDERKMFKDKPHHDWTSHGADAFRYMAIACQEEVLPAEAKEQKWPLDRNFNEMINHVRRRRKAED